MVVATTVGSRTRGRGGLHGVGGPATGMKYHIGISVMPVATAPIVGVIPTPADIECATVVKSRRKIVAPVTLTADVAQIPVRYPFIRDSLFYLQNTKVKVPMESQYGVKMQLKDLLWD